ncbi:thioredoxin family protein [Candidatus Daviesbacteria bacterium]|nr:thioredoxin family protein [Candidatus Daviesbacteria bacterium]
MKPFNIFIILSLISIFAGFIFLKDGFLKKGDGSNIESSEILQESKINYIDYSQENLKQVSRNGRAILFFHANWCPTCNALDKELKTTSLSLPQDVTLIKTDFDKEKALKEKYKIIQQHTLVLVDKDGNEIKKWIGGGVWLIAQQLN